VTGIERSGDAFAVRSTDGTFEARRVVLATGGQSLPKSGSDGDGYRLARELGHSIVATTPALAPLLVDPCSIHRAVAGVSQAVELLVWIDGAVAVRLAGPLLWTHFGVSGPVALNASRHWMRAHVEKRPVSVTLNFCPGRSFEAVDRLLQDAAAQSPKASPAGFLADMLPASVAQQLVTRLDLDPRVTLAHLSREARRRLAHTLVEFPLPVTGTRGYNFAEATAGGVALDEINPATMESRVCPGLHLIGEVLDVDGRLGGFNFQWAWSSGFVAGRAVARSVGIPD
jgi:hypothetical protein